MGTLLDEFDADAATLEVGRCPVRKWLLAHPDTEPLLLSDRKASQVIPWLEKRVGPLPFDHKSLLAHRRRLAGRNGCRCPIS